jgi:elongation factor Ts
MKVTADQIRKLREETGAPISRAKKVLEELGGDMDKATEILRQEGFEKTEKRADRETSQGIIATYVHHSGKLGVMIELLCETDFVARNEVFQQLGKDLAMHVSFTDAKDADELSGQEFIKDSSQKISDLIKSAIAKTGENIRVGRISRIELGK